MQIYKYDFAFVVLAEIQFYALAMLSSYDSICKPPFFVKYLNPTYTRKYFWTDKPIKLFHGLHSTVTEKLYSLQYLNKRV